MSRHGAIFILVATRVKAVSADGMPPSGTPCPYLPDARPLTASFKMPAKIIVL
jgi:hypothetical protein